MNASYEWLREFTDFALTPTELRDVLTARVATVDEVVPLRGDLAGIVVARVVEAGPHPDSDHLSVTRVDAGTGELLDVVCGAPNVRAGGKYPFAPVGATLPGGLRIERRKIRGQSSNGMLCSARELGLGVDHSGILTLETDAAPGTPFLRAYPAGDTRLVVDVLPNRPDLLSHLGLAREIAAHTRGVVRVAPPGAAMPAERFEHALAAGDTAGVRVHVEPDTRTPLYIAVVIRDVHVGPSPEWLVQRLDGAGVRSINNVVDATNYMLHGFGQPMHAFDLAKLGENVSVRNARAGERIVTLDGVERELRDGMVVIAGDDRPHAVAGVIGGHDSAVSDATTDILLEVAVFDPQSVRSTRRALGISTDASYRFERGVDAHAAEDLARYAAGLVVSVAGGAVDGTPVLVGAPGALPAPLHVSLDRVARLLGARIAAREAAALLQPVGFDVSGVDDDSVVVQPPSWRPDVVRQADVAEEIARLYGYDAFPSELRPFRVGRAGDAPAYVVTRRVSAALVQCGLLEVRPMPFVADAGAHGVRVTNPLAESEAVLRSSLLQTLTRRVEHNFAHMTRDVRLFEVGVGFTRAETGPLPVERLLAAAVVTGDRYPAHFTDQRPPAVDLWDARWVGERMAAAAFGEGRAQLQPAGNGWSVVLDGMPVGTISEVAVDAPVWAAPVYGIEIDLSAALVGDRTPPTYRALPTTPAAEFDLALLVPLSVSAVEVERAIAHTAGELLEALVPFDQFRGSGVPDGYRSVAWRLTFRHPERTLRDREIEGRRAAIVRALEAQLGVRPRTA